MAEDAAAAKKRAAAAEEKLRVMQQQPTDDIEPLFEEEPEGTWSIDQLVQQIAQLQQALLRPQ